MVNLSTTPSVCQTNTTVTNGATITALCRANASVSSTRCVSKPTAYRISESTINQTATSIANYFGKATANYFSATISNGVKAPTARCVSKPISNGAEAPIYNHAANPPLAMPKQQSSTNHRQQQPVWDLLMLLATCEQVCRNSEWRMPRYRVRNSSAATISSVAHDSRAVTDGALFFALAGWSVDGHRFIEPAIASGAVAVVHSRPLAVYHPQVCYIRTRYPRKLMSLIADVYYGSPSTRLVIVGVTGTDGKSTSCNFVYQLLRAHGISCGLVSTVSRDTGSGLIHNTDHQTTPESIDIHKALATMVYCGYTHAVLELSSHALSHITARALHVRLRCAIITNIAQEHLEFHKTVRRYVRDKLNIISLISNHRVKASYNTENQIGEGSFGTAVTGIGAGRDTVADVSNRAEVGTSLGMDTAVVANTKTGAHNSITHQMKLHAKTDRAIERVGSSNTEKGTVGHIENRTEATVEANAIPTTPESAMPIVLCGTTAPITRRIAAQSHYPVLNYNPDYNRNLSLSCVKHALTDSSYQYIIEGEALDISVGFFGRYNILNATAAILCVSRLLSLPPASIATHCNALSLPTGRFDILTRRHKCAFDVVVDYAHTAQSFTVLLNEIRGMDYRRILVVFGSAGERDVQKRHDMGLVAARYCDVIIITSEDPRNERPQNIADNIINGVFTQTQPKHPFEVGNNICVIHNRKQAIFHAVSLLQPHDILLLLGKGHEASIISNTKQIVWNERQVAQQALAKHHGIHR